jgi:succinate dehydrogenase / fumarate reductase membrane anchor subunit
MILSIISIFLHAALGTQVIAEDYIGGATRLVTVMGIRFVLFAGAVLSIFSVLKVAFGA